MPKKARKAPVGKAAANGKRLPRRSASAVAKGAVYAVLAGRPSKQAVIAVFGKTRYALSWVARADRLGLTQEELCDRFKADPNRVKKLWAESTAEKDKAQDATASALVTCGGHGAPLFATVGAAPESGRRRVLLV